MPKRLTLIVHAETAATRRGAFPADEEVDPHGREAAGRLEPTLPRPARAFTSPAFAARETAAVLGLQTEIAPSLADLDVGRWAGRSVTDIGAEDPDGASAWLEDPAFAGHGGESFMMLGERVAAWLAARVAADGLTIAITHAAVVRAAAIAVLGAGAAAFWRIEAPPLAMLTLGSDGRRWMLRELRHP